MWVNNILQIISVAVSLSLLLLWLFQKRIGLQNEKAVLFGIIFNLLYSIFDLLSRIAIISGYSDSIISISYKLSLIFMFLEIVFVLVFLFSNLLLSSQGIIFKVLFIFVFIVGAGLSFISNIDYLLTEEEALLTISTSSLSLIYYFLIIVAVLFIILALVLGNRIGNLKKIATICWCFIFLLGAIVNYFFNNIASLSVSFSLALIVAISISENFENYYNIELGSFQYDAFMAYLKTKYLKRKPLSLVYVYIFNEKNEFNKELTSTDEINLAINELKKVKHIDTFKTQTNELVVCFKDSSIIDDVSSYLKQLFDEYEASINYANRVNASIVAVEDIHIVSSFIDLLNLLKSSRNNNSYNPLDVSVVKIDNTYVEKLNTEIEVLKELDYAIENDGVVLNYQPVYSVHDNSIKSVEILTRIKSSNGQIIMPGQFLPVAEKYGRIVQLGEKILIKSCEFYNEMISKGILLDDISVNFSSYQLEDSAIINSIIDAISNNKMSPASLCIEVTSVKAIRRRKDFMKNINKLYSFGVPISFTGYGSNDSGLEYLTEMTTDLVRLDRNFIWKALSDEKTSIILDNVIDLAHKFKIKIVAVGVEDEVQYNKVIEKGVDFIQGMYIGKPMDKDSFVTFINERAGN